MAWTDDGEGENPMVNDNVSRRGVLSAAGAVTAIALGAKAAPGDEPGQLPMRFDRPVERMDFSNGRFQKWGDSEGFKVPIGAYRPGLHGIDLYFPVDTRAISLWVTGVGVLTEVKAGEVRGEGPVLFETISVELRDDVQGDDLGRLYRVVFRVHSNDANREFNCYGMGIRAFEKRE